MAVGSGESSGGGRTINKYLVEVEVVVVVLVVS